MPNWRRIVIHHSAGHDTDGLDLDAIDRFHREQRGWRAVGYHAMVEQVGDRYVGVMARPWTLVGSHEPQANDNGLGVCFVGNFQDGPPPDEQVEVGADLIASMLHLLGNRWFLPMDELIVPHRRFKATLCPGEHFPLQALRSKVTERLRAAER